MSENTTESDALVEFTPDESNPTGYHFKTDEEFAALTSAEKQAEQYGALREVNASVDRLHARLDYYDHLLDGGIESVNRVMEAAENNPMIRNILGL